MKFNPPQVHSNPSFSWRRSGAGSTRLRSSRNAFGFFALKGEAGSLLFGGELDPSLLGGGAALSAALPPFDTSAAMTLVLAQVNRSPFLQ